MKSRFEQIYDKCNSNKVLFYAYLIVFFILVFILNRLFPLLLDDWSYSQVHDESRPIEGLYDIFVSQYNHYFTWGGRSVVHFIAQALLFLDPWIHDLLNSIILVVFVWLIYKIANKDRERSLSLLITISILIWVWQPQSALTLFWMTGSANYLWGTSIIIAFMYPYYSYYRKLELKDGIAKSIAFLFAGILAGWTNENTAIGLIFFLVGILILLRIEKKAIPVWMSIGLIGVIIGCTIMLLAPGNMVRYEAESGLSSGESSILSLSTIGKRLLKMLSAYRIRIIWLVLIDIAFYFCFKRTALLLDKDRIRRIAFLFLLTAHVAFFPLIALNGFPSRALFGVITFLIISGAILYANINLKKALYKKINLIFITLLLVAFISDYVPRAKAFAKINKVLEEREIYAKEQRDKGVKYIIFRNKLKLSSRYGFTEITDDTHHWANRSYAGHYGVDSVRVIEPIKE